MNAHAIDQLKVLGQKLATEIVFAEPGANDGLLSLNCLIGEVEQLAAGTDAPEALTQAARCARRWIDELFDANATFTALAVERFRAWTKWIQHAAEALEQQRALPKLPDNWQTPSLEMIPGNPTPAAVLVTTAPAEEEPELEIDTAADAELLREFLNESAEHLHNIEHGVLALEENPADADTLDSVFRAFHTFKGGAGFLNLTAIQTLAHQLESLLHAARTGKLRITPAIVDVILAGGDTLKRFMSEIDARITGRTPAHPIVVPTLDLLARVRGILENIPVHDEAIVSSRTPSVVEPLQSAADDAVPTPCPPAPALLESPAPNGQLAAETGAGNHPPSATAVKVDTNKLDSLVDLVGELVIAQSLVVQNRALVALEHQQLSRDLAQLGRITKELQRTATSLRMVPIRSTFQKMNRLVRDIAFKTGKQVELVIDGEETELDRNIVEEISDPLAHMIRNAIDHGIESPEVRLQHGKPAQGTVELRACYQGGNIVIEIHDDGRGLDKQRILLKGIEKGLVRPETSLNDNEIFNLIFAPGFSTAETITDLSGRGVGMDVVRRNVERLRGKTEIQSTLGEGATFRIYLPLTLAIIDGLIVGVAEQRYILPTLSVCESFRPTAGMLNSVNGRAEMLNVRGRLRPVLRLYEHLGITPASEDPTQSIAILVESGKDSRCVLVDQLLGKQEVVIKTLGETFKRSPILAGAAILGDGRVGLILDPNALVHLNADTHSEAA